MGAIGVVLLVAFIIVSILLVLLVLVQDSGDNGMGGLLGGRGTAAFGSHSSNVLNKATFVLVILFFALVLGLALTNKSSKGDLDLSEVKTVKTETVEDKEEANEVVKDKEDKQWYLKVGETDADVTAEIEAAPEAEESTEAAL